MKEKLLIIVYLLSGIIISSILAGIPALLYHFVGSDGIMIGIAVSIFIILPILIVIAIKILQKINEIRKD